MEQAGKDFLLLEGNGKAGEEVTFTATTDRVGLVGHGLKDGDVVTFTEVEDTAVPTNTDFYVFNANTDDFQLSEIDPTDEDDGDDAEAVDLDVDGAGEMGEGFTVAAGIRSKSMTINNEPIDVTNQGSNQFRKLLDKAGIKSLDGSGSGVFDTRNGSLERIEDAALDGALKRFRLVFLKANRTFEAKFKVASMEYGGEYNGEHTYSISLQSSGKIKRTKG